MAPKRINKKQLEAFRHKLKHGKDIADEEAESPGGPGQTDDTGRSSDKERLKNGVDLHLQQNKNTNPHLGAGVPPAKNKQKSTARAVERQESDGSNPAQQMKPSSVEQEKQKHLFATFPKTLWLYFAGRHNEDLWKNLKALCANEVDTDVADYDFENFCLYIGHDVQAGENKRPLGYRLFKEVKKDKIEIYGKSIGPGDPECHLSREQTQNDINEAVLAAKLLAYERKTNKNNLWEDKNSACANWLNLGYLHGTQLITAFKEEFRNNCRQERVNGGPWTPVFFEDGPDNFWGDLPEESPGGKVVRMQPVPYLFFKFQTTLLMCAPRRDIEFDNLLPAVFLDLNNRLTDIKIAAGRRIGDEQYEKEPTNVEIMRSMHEHIPTEDIGKLAIPSITELRRVQKIIKLNNIELDDCDLTIEEIRNRNRAAGGA
ncbi:unnamed protein product [Amoebophrya sp. A120]|nr:unnamed protein product [Amoebophrya sp. A120]|eukprot:GSA120T00012910001.1